MTAVPLEMKLVPFDNLIINYGTNYLRAHLVPLRAVGLQNIVGDACDSACCEVFLCGDIYMVWVASIAPIHLENPRIRGNMHSIRNPSP